MANNVPSARLVTWRDSSDGLVTIQKLRKCPSRIFASPGSVTTENEHPENNTGHGSEGKEHNNEKRLG